jgi:hypothetical protein
VLNFLHYILIVNMKPYLAIMLKSSSLNREFKLHSLSLSHCVCVCVSMCVCVHELQG